MKNTGHITRCTVARRTAAALILLALLGTPAPAAPRAQAGGREQMREDLQQTVEIYMLARMKRVLQLDDDQTRTIIPLMEQLNASRRSFGRQRRHLLMRIRPLIEIDPDDATITDILEELYAIEREHRETEVRVHAAIRKSLSPVQQARFLFFQERFREEMQDRVRGLMREGRGPGGPDDARPRRRP